MTWDHFNMWLYGMISAMVGGIIFLVRMVFTNNTQLQLLKQQLNIQNEALEKRDDKIDAHLDEIRNDVKALMRYTREP